MSTHFPDKEIAFVYVNCFGGQCWSEGYTLKMDQKYLSKSLIIQGIKRS